MLQLQKNSQLQKNYQLQKNASQTDETAELENQAVSDSKGNQAVPEKTGQPDSMQRKKSMGQKVSAIGFGARTQKLDIKRTSEPIRQR